MSKDFKPDVSIHEGSYSRFIVFDKEEIRLGETSYSLKDAIERARTYLATCYPDAQEHKIALEISPESLKKLRAQAI